MNINSKGIVVAALIGVAGVATAAAQGMPTAQTLSTIRVTGEAAVPTPPDEAILEIGVTTQAATAQAAAAENAEKVERVLAALRKDVGPGGTVQTLSYNLTPDYRQIREDQQPRIVSYTAYNILRVKLTDFARVGKLIDQGIAAGANNVQRVDFIVKEQNRAHQEALTSATALAMQKAEAMAAALKMRVVRIIALEEGGGYGIPYRGASADRMAMATTNIEPGNIDLRATVSLLVEIGN
jgi:uncharacterized protein YggE